VHKIDPGVRVRIEFGTCEARDGKLLVIMTEHDSVQKLMPCLETLARPGMAVIFLFQYPVDSRSYFRDHRITVESARHATAVGRDIVYRYDWEAQKELAQQIMAPVVGNLQNKVSPGRIHLYSGRLAKAIKNYCVDSDIHWILTNFHVRFDRLFSQPGLVRFVGGPAICCPRGSRPELSEEQGGYGHTIDRTAR
jgi:hypothetical protein